MSLYALSDIIGRVIRPKNEETADSVKYVKKLQWLRQQLSRF